MTTTETTKTWPLGYRINPRAAAPDAALVESFRDIPVAVAGDCMGRGLGAIGLTAYHADIRASFRGPAFTVRVRPGDNLMIHKALTMVQPGDVLVIDAAGDLTQALIGGLMRTTMLRCGLAGVVIDGALRDLTEWAEGGMPVFARGHTHRGPSKNGPGEINVPVACGGMVVMPGDLVLADADGVIAVPQADLPALLEAARAHLKKEEAIRASNASGDADPERFDAILRKQGVPV